MKFRIIKCEEDGIEYYLQIKEWIKWRTTCGVDKGAFGYYHYQLNRSGNPYYLVRYTMQEIIAEKRQPSIDRTTRFITILRSYFEKMGEIKEIISVDEIQKKLDNHAQKLIHSGIKGEQVMPRHWMPSKEVEQELVELYIGNKGW